MTQIDDVQPQKEAIKRDLLTMTRRWGELEDKAVFELRAIAPDREKQPHSGKFLVDEIDAAVEWAKTINESGYNLYVTRNPIRHDTTGSAKDEDVLAAFYVWADCDDRQASANVLGFEGPKWTWAVTTGKLPWIRAHVYWELEEPIMNMKAWRGVQEGIAAYFQSDDKVVNPSRIMRLGGTITHPAKNKIAKGYKSEVCTIRTSYEDDRDPISFDTAHGLFGNVKPQVASQSLLIDLGDQPLDREREKIKALAGEEWNNAVFKLVGSYIAKHMSDQEIHALTQPLTIPPYTTDDTYAEVQSMIDRTRSNPKFESVEVRPDPVVEVMEAQQDQNNWPTAVEQINALALPKRHWVYGKTYIRKYVTLTASAGGIGKTSLTMVEALAIVTGRALLGEEVKEQTNVWLLNLEDPLEEMQLRLAAAMQHYKIEHKDIAGKLFMDAEDTMQMTLAAESRDGLVQNDALLELMTKRIVDNNIGVVIIDPFVSTHLVNENNNASIQAVVGMLRKLARDTRCSVHPVHHVRKGNGEESTIDSVRGAGSLIGAARAARVINRLPEAKAIELGVPQNQSKGIMRIDDGKANLAPPAEAAVYAQMIGVELANSEWVGVATKFKLPDEFAGMTDNVANILLSQIEQGPEPGEKYSLRPQDKARWAGSVIMEYPFDSHDKKNEGQAKSILKRWLDNDLIEVGDYRSEAQRKNKKGIIRCGRVGEIMS